MHRKIARERRVRRAGGTSRRTAVGCCTSRYVLQSYNYSECVRAPKCSDSMFGMFVAVRGVWWPSCARFSLSSNAQLTIANGERRELRILPNASFFIFRKVADRGRAKKPRPDYQSGRGSRYLEQWSSRAVVFSANGR